MSPMTRYATKHAKAGKRRRLKAQQRLKQQRAQACTHSTDSGCGLPLTWGKNVLCLSYPLDVFGGRERLVLADCCRVGTRSISRIQ